MNKLYDIDLIGYAFILIIIIGFLVGFKRGFVSSLLKSFKGIIAIIGAFLLAKPLGKILCNTDIGLKISSAVTDALIDKGDFFNTVVTAENRDLILNEVFSQIKLPDVIANFIKSLIPETGGESIATYLGQTIAYFVCVLIAFIVLFIVIRIIVRILRNFLDFINKIPLVGLVNRLAGAAYSAVLSILFIGVICWLISLIITIPGGVTDYLVHSMKLDSTDMTISKWCYEKNIIGYLFNLMF